MSKAVFPRINRQQEISDIVEAFHCIRNKLISENGKFPGSGQITYSQWRVLLLVHRRENVSLKKIATELSITSSAATQLVDALVAGGHVIRSMDPSDRRSVRIRLAGKMHKNLSSMNLAVTQRIAILFSTLSDEELREFARLHKKIAAALSPK